jgi:hypothetical protein
VARSDAQASIAARVCARLVPSLVPCSYGGCLASVERLKLSLADEYPNPHE